MVFDGGPCDTNIKLSQVDARNTKRICYVVFNEWSTDMACLASNDPTVRKSCIFYGWFVVTAAFAITLAGFGSAYTFSSFVASLEKDFGASARLSFVGILIGSDSCISALA